MSACSSVSAATCAPPPWPTPWMRRKMTFAPSSTCARKRSKTSKLRVWTLAPAPISNTNRVCAATPPATWQRVHLPCTMGAMCSPKTPAAVVSSGAENVDRFATWPLGAGSKLITSNGFAARIASRHAPAPSPNAPTKPLPPDSNWAAVRVRTVFARIVTRTWPSVGVPPSSTPEIVASTSASFQFTTRSRPPCPPQSAGAKNATSMVSPVFGAVAFPAIKKPSSAREYTETCKPNDVYKRSRHAPSPRPNAPARPFSLLPCSKSSDVKCATAPAASWRKAGP